VILHEAVCLRAKISSSLREADKAAFQKNHQLALKHIATAALMIRELRDSEELERQEIKHDLAALELAHGG